MRVFLAMQARPYKDLRGSGVIENILPFTQVEKRFKDDCYAETNPPTPPVLRDVDDVAEMVDLYLDGFFGD